MGVYSLEQPSAYNAETITVDATADGVSLTSSIYKGTAQAVMGATRVYITVETAPFRYLYCPTAKLTVTSAIGHLANIGDVIVLEGAENIDNFRAIRTSGVSAVITVTYESG